MWPSLSPGIDGNGVRSLAVAPVPSLNIGHFLIKDLHTGRVNKMPESWEKSCNQRAHHDVGMNVSFALTPNY